MKFVKNLIAGIVIVLTLAMWLFLADFALGSTVVNLEGEQWYRIIATPSGGDCIFPHVESDGELMAIVSCYDDTSVTNWILPYGPDSEYMGFSYIGGNGEQITVNCNGTDLLWDYVHNDTTGNYEVYLLCWEWEQPTEYKVYLPVVNK